MVPKRNFIDDDEDNGSEFPAREPKRHNAFGGIFLDMVKERPHQELARKLEPLIRRWVREEVERVFSSSLRSTNDQIGSSGSSTWQLHFDDKIPPTLFTGTSVESEDNKPVKIVLRDAASMGIIATGPLSFIKVKIVVLDGDFNPDDREDWSEQDFDNKTIKEREGKRPLVTGNLVVQLRDGVGFVNGICFTDNSSWIRGRKFRLGAKVHTVSAGVRIREGVSKEFQVKDHRGESYKKHHPPSLNDEVWRLEKIAKEGVSHRRLTQREIFTVKEFLRLYVTNPNLLRTILDNGAISEKRWKTITDHANSCVLDDNELYMYEAAEGIGVVFNSIYKVLGLIFDGQNYQSLDKLDNFQKQMVETLKQCAYKNIDHLVPIDCRSVIGFSVCQTQLSSPQANPFSSSGLYPDNINLPIEQDQVEVQINSDHTTISPSYTCEVEENNQFEVSVAESSQRMQEFNSTLRNSFSLTDAYYGHNIEGYSSYPTFSMSPLMSSGHLALKENFQVEESATQESELFTSPTGAAIRSDFGIHNSRNRKPKARWCKLRAVIKWLILVRHKWLLRQWQELFL